MIPVGPDLSIDLSFLWAWFLLVVRFTGLLTTLPGVGTDEIPASFRAVFSLVLAAMVTMLGPKVAQPEHLAEGALMLATEFVLGFALGMFPSMVLSSASVAGQVIAGAIGLGQANMIDPTLGESVSVLSRLQVLIAVSVFLAVDGHHALVRAAILSSSDLGLGVFRPSWDGTQILLNQFRNSFILAVTLSGPILVTILVTNFVLGLVTKFVPQVNIFIVSMPLTIAIGLYLLEFTFPSFKIHLISHFSHLEDAAEGYISSGSTGVRDPVKYSIEATTTP